MVFFFHSIFVLQIIKIYIQSTVKLPSTPLPAPSGISLTDMAKSYAVDIQDPVRKGQSVTKEHVHWVIFYIFS